jgi:hypothetical protein
MRFAARGLAPCLRRPARPPPALGPAARERRRRARSPWPPGSLPAHPAQALRRPVTPAPRYYCVARRRLEEQSAAAGARGSPADRQPGSTRAAGEAFVSVAVPSPAGRLRGALVRAGSGVRAGAGARRGLGAGRCPRDGRPRGRGEHEAVARVERAAGRGVDMGASQRLAPSIALPGVWVAFWPRPSRSLPFLNARPPTPTPRPHMW